MTGEGEGQRSLEVEGIGMKDYQLRHTRLQQPPPLRTCRQWSGVNTKRLGSESVGVMW